MGTGPAITRSVQPPGCVGGVQPNENEAVCRQLPVEVGTIALPYSNAAEHCNTTGRGSPHQRVESGTGIQPGLRPQAAFWYVVTCIPSESLGSR